MDVTQEVIDQLAISRVIRLIITDLQNPVRGFSESIISSHEATHFGVIYEGDEELDQDDIKRDIEIFKTNIGRITYNTNPLSQIKVKGSEAGKHYYFRRDSQGISGTAFSAILFNEASPIDVLQVNYFLVETRLSLSQTLTARVYKYKCRFKWLSNTGIGERSQFSDVISVISIDDIGKEENQPTFLLNFLNLTSKLDQSLKIEVYRTIKNTDTFLFLKEIQNNKLSQNITFTDDVLDKDLGKVADPNNFLMSGAKYVTDYQSRFVLWGFAENPNLSLIHI